MNLDKKHDLYLKNCYDHVIEEFAYTKDLDCEQELYLYADNSIKRVELNPTNKKAIWHQYPTYLPEQQSFVMWAYVVVEYFNPVVTNQDVDITFTVAATQPNIGETRTKDITTRLFNSLDPLLEVHNDTITVDLF